MSERIVKTIPLEKIYASEEFNCRGEINPVSVVDLAKNIKENGLMQPISVTEINDEHRKIIKTEYTGFSDANEGSYEYFLIAGFRRYMAHKINQSATIEALIQGAMSFEKQLVFNLNENIQREELSLIQEARSLNKLLRMGMTEFEIAEQTNTSRGWVQIRKMLLQLPPELQEEFEAGLLLQTHIRDLYTEFNNNGKDACITYAKTVKDAKANGLVHVPKPKSAKKKSAKRIRKRGEIYELMETLQQSVGFGLHTRTLAWAAGEINDGEIHESIKEHADSLGLEYTIPNMGE